MTDNRTTELLPCPFCGGEAEIKKLCDECSPEINFKCEHDKSQSATCPIGEKVFWAEHSGECKVVHSEGEPFYTDSFTQAQQAVEAWNTRADYHGYEQAAIEAWQNVKAYKERTCRIVNRGGLAGSVPLFTCEECEALFYGNAYGEAPNYCPNCGAKVVQL